MADISEPAIDNLAKLVSDGVALRWALRLVTELAGWTVDDWKSFLDEHPEAKSHFNNYICQEQIKLLKPLLDYDSSHQSQTLPPLLP